MESMDFLTFVGLPGRTNKILVYCPVKPTRIVMYFQGDIQDLRRNMEERYEDISRWKEWSLDNTMTILRQRFPESAIFIVKPSNVLRDTYCCYHNFVKSSIVGTPEYDSSHGAIPHLQLLLKHCYTHITTTSGGRGSDLNPENLPIVLVGFSKGCVVLNQILHELESYFGTGNETSPYTNTGSNLPPGLASVAAALATQEPTTDGNVIEFLKQIDHMFWLDSGHSGDGEAWVTKRHLLEMFSRLKVGVHVHVSPHQINCPNRPWIGEEEKVFVSTLRELGVNVTEKIHFEDQPRSFLNHFRILNEF